MKKEIKQTLEFIAIIVFVLLLSAVNDTTLTNLGVF